LKLATGIIPARYCSSRFPGKPLAPLLGKPMIQWVYERALQATLLEEIIIATDDRRIFDAARSFGAEARMTSGGHRSGTERAAEVAASLNTPLIVNIQGDEPLLEGTMIDKLIESLQEETIPMATLALKVYEMDKIFDRNLVKVVKDSEGFALYFSRSPIPNMAKDYFWLHIGIYGYQRDFLREFPSLQATRLEKTEKLEQLRALENGFRIKVVETECVTLSVDTPTDIIKVEKFLMKQKND
jgi:3-deoxy-manno-octulosonate cytidylyltransferase (CMP-KDO synthetase)